MRGGNYLQLETVDNENTFDIAHKNGGLYSGIMYPNTAEIASVSCPSKTNVYFEDDWVKKNAHNEGKYQMDDKHGLEYHINGIVHSIQNESTFIYLPIIVLLIILLFQK